jgi:3-hydroxyisobutyrate dehydrogenase
MVMAGKVGFVGVGAMGGPMALNLVKAGFEVFVHDINPDRVAALAAAGARVVDSPAAAAAECRRTICMVETADQAEAVIFGENGFVQKAQPRDIVICSSTIDPLLARQFAQRLADKGIGMLDAPVSGGPHGAAAATLSVIVGGPEDSFAAAQDLFRAMGKNVFHVGRHGMGLAMKLINNMLGQIQTVAIAEAMVLGKKAGLDPKKIYEVVSASTGNSVQFQNRVPRILARNFKPGGTLDISFKDQELETAFAKRLGVPLLLANVSQQVYQMGRAAGLSKEDGSSLVKVYERLAGVTVSGEDSA